MDKPRGTKSLILHIILILGAIVMIVPFVWMTLTAFKTNSEAMQVNPFLILPKVWHIDSFKEIIRKLDFPMLYLNTLVLVFGRVVCAVLTATMAGYALGRLNFKGKNVAFVLVMMQMMVPSQIFILPQYLMISSMDMLDTRFALLFPGLVSAFGTFLLRQSYMGLPKDLEEAARIDGCSIFKTFLFVMAPLTKSGMVALGIFTALFGYKELMWPLIVNQKPDMLTLSAALARMQGQNYTDYPELMAASLLACVPMVVIYIIFQKQFIEGIATSGSKL